MRAGIVADLDSHHDDEPEQLVDDPAPRHGVVLPSVAVRGEILLLPGDHHAHLGHYHDHQLRNHLVHLVHDYHNHDHHHHNLDHLVCLDP